RRAAPGLRALRAFAGAIDAVDIDALLAGAVLADRPQEGIDLVGGNFEDCFRVENTNGTNSLLGDTTGLADERQQPARVGALFAADIDLEAGATGKSLACARAARGIYCKFSDFLGDRASGKLHAQIGHRKLFGCPFG